MNDRPRRDITMQALEQRTHLSASPAAAAAVTELAAAAPRATASTAVRRAVAPTLTLADRQELLANWVGSDRKTLRSFLLAGNTAGFDAELLRYMRTRTNVHYYFDQADIPGILNFFNVDIGLKKQKANKIAKADDIVAHRFPEIVNSTTYDVQLPAKIDWLHQPASNDNTEFPYSLNRHFYWADLAMAYRFTGDAKYATELKGQLDSWSRQVVRLSDPDDWHDARPQWDIFVTAERVKNWMYAYNILLGGSAWTAEANTLFLHRLLVQGDFLNRVGNTYEPESNKATGHGTALYEVAMMFPEFANSAAWEDRGEALMFGAMGKQFRADGGHYEQSPQYHGGAMNGFLEAYQLAALNGQAWGSKTVRRLVNIFNYFFQLLSPDGTQAALSDTYRSTGTIVFTTARLVLDQPQWPKSRPRLDDVWTLGVAESTKLLSAPTYGTLSGRGQTAKFATSGYYATRSGDDRDARQLIFDAGPKGGTHGHFDLLNFELYGYGHPLIQDPGLLSYSASYAKARLGVISTPAHNTISIDGQNHAASESPTIARLTQFSNTSAGVQMAATSYGYTGLSGSPVVARNIFHDHGNAFLVVDFGSASKSHTFTQSFNLFTTNATAFANGVIRTTTGNGDVMLQPLLIRGQSVKTNRATLSNTAPPAGTTSGTRVAISQTGDTALFATLVVAYDNGQVPNVSARWLKYPTAKRAGQVELTKNGVKSVVFITRPNLSASGRSASSVSRSVAGVAPAVTPKFSVKAIEKDEDAVFA